MNTSINTSAAMQAMNTAEFSAQKRAGDAETVAKVTELASVVSLKAATAPDETASPSDDEVTDALNVVNKAAVFEQRSLSFQVDEASGRSIIKVIDRSTEQLIRQIPSEELLKVAQDIKRLQEEMGQSLGFLIDRRV